MVTNIGILVKSLDTYGGGERVAARLCHDLSEHYNVELVEFYPNDTVYSIPQYIKRNFIHEEEKQLRKIFFSSIYKLRKIICDSKINILIVVGKFSWPIVPMLASRGLSVKVIFWDQGTLKGAKFVRTTWKKKLFGSLQQYMINTCAHSIVTLTDKEKINYINTYPGYRKKIKAIRNYITEIPELPEYNIESKKIITVGRIDYAKGYEYLIDIAEHVFKSNPSWEWHIYGDGDKAYKQALEEKVHRKGLSHKIIFKGAHKNILDIYPQYSFFVLTSRYEGFALVLLEAMSKGLPLVSFDIFSGPSDMIAHNQNGYLITPYDCEMMAKYINILIANPRLREEMHCKCHDNIQAFSKEKSVSQWISLINKMLIM